MAEQIKNVGCTIKDVANSVCDKATAMASAIAEKTSTSTTKLVKSSSSDGKAVLGYWNVRGIVGYIRLMLEYCNESYEDKIYDDFPDSMEKAKEMRAKHEGCEWYKEKMTTGMDFPNMPYLYIDGYRISQSRAIMRYLARKHHLEGKTEQDRLNIDMLDEALKDFLMWHVQLVYFTPKPFYRTARQSYIDNTLPENLDLISKYLGNERQYVAGNYLTYCDFLLYEYLDIQRLYAPEAVAKFENLMLYLERIEELPRLKEYMQSERFMRTPVFAPFAAWNGRTRRESFLAGSPPGSGTDSHSADESLHHDEKTIKEEPTTTTVKTLNVSATKVTPSNTNTSD